MSFDPGLGVVALERPLGFRYEPGTFGPQPELRSLDAIRPSLRNQLCDGPDPVYAIVMDVGRSGMREELERRMLLFGVVTYAAGRLGDEPVRRQMRRIPPLPGRNVGLERRVSGGDPLGVDARDVSPVLRAKVGDLDRAHLQQLAETAGRRVGEIGAFDSAS